MSEVDQTMEKATSHQSPPRKLSSEPSSWLVPSLADLDERMKMLLISACEEDNAGDTFAERAECYYQKRPQLIALLKDLYNGYMTLLDRCDSTKRKLHCRGHSSALDHDYNDQEEDEDGETSQIDSDLESSLSYQQPSTLNPTHSHNTISNIDEIVAQLVTKNVENDILLHQLGDMEQLCNESSRKIELLKKLLELLESERMILLNENLKLGYKATSLLEENKGLASEAMFMKGKAAELARCVLRMREDHRVFVLGQKVEYLQGQIYGLEKRNKEYYQLLMKKDQEVKEEKTSNMKEKNKNGGHEVALGGCFQLEKLKLKKRDGVASNGTNVKGIGEKRMPRWWERVMNMDLFMCGLHPTSP